MGTGDGNTVLKRPNPEHYKRFMLPFTGLKFASLLGHKQVLDSTFNYILENIPLKYYKQGNFKNLN